MQRKILLTLIGVLGVAGSAACLNRNAYAIEDYTPSVTVSVGNKVGFSNLSAPNGTTDVANYYVPVNINVDNISKYFISVYMDCNGSANENACRRGELVNGDNSIVGVDGSKMLTGMSDEWGFRYNVGNVVSKPDGKYFSAMATSRDHGWIDNGEGGTAFLTNSATNSDRKVLTLDFGAAVGSSAVSGTYTGRAVVTVVATPLEVTFASYGIPITTKMQNFTTAQCNKVDMGAIGALTDSRDNKIYKVAKLKDGNCWMIQNLALEGGTKITPANSNVTSEYTLPVPSTRYMNNGTHVDNKYDNYLLPEGSTLVGYGDGSGDNTGAFYQWNVATADFDTSGTFSGEATQSICPKGWRLPSSTGTDEGQFDKLVRLYGSGKSFDIGWRSGFVGTHTGNDYSYVGEQGRYWSRNTAGAVAYDLMQYSSNNSVGAHGGNYRSFLFSVRCIFQP